MTIRLFILFSFASFFGYTQSIDSLLFQLNSIENDTESVNQLYNKGFNLRNSEPDNAWLFADACYKKAIKSNNQKHLAKAYNLLGILYYKKTHYLKALQYQKKALALNQTIHYETGCAMNLSNLGNIYSDINYFKFAETSYLQALQLNNKLENTKGITRCLINIAALKHTQKQDDAAVLNLKQALIYADKLGDYELIATCNNNIGIALTSQNKLDTALAYLQDGLKLRTMIEDEVDLANSYLNIADVLTKQKKYSEAQNYLSLAENSCKSYEIYDELVNFYSIKSEWFEGQAKYDSSIFYLKKHHHLKDSLFKIETEKVDINDIDTTFSLKEEGNRYKTMALVAIISLILGSLISYFIFRKK